jgi:phosphotransferase system enzyme I (PtsI)
MNDSVKNRSLTGVSLSPGASVGAVRVVRQIPFVATGERIPPEHFTRELASFDAATVRAKEELAALIARGEATLGKEKAAVFEAHTLMLEDPMLLSGIRERIGAGRSAPDAVVETTGEIKAMFEAIPDAYLRERADDVEDVGRRLFRKLLGFEEIDLEGEPFILVAEELAPSETALFTREKVLGVILERGGATSHSAILLRSLEIPAISGIEGACGRFAGVRRAVCDGDRGVAVIEPSESEEEALRSRVAKRERARAELREISTAPARTADGIDLPLWGNMAKPEDTAKILEGGGTGVGLFRTEFLFMDRPQPPSEEEQVEAYRAALRGMKGAPVVIRTLDAGGDKKVPYLAGEQPEENPFLGFRAIRLCLKKPGLFRTQLRALLRASTEGDLRIMLPMVSGLQEVRETKKLLAECAEELRSEGFVPAERIPLGIMVEIPSAAILAREFAKEVDFFSIGTNDLTQYTLAVDRMNPQVASWYDAFHPAVLRLIAMTAEAAREAGIEIGMCGELAGDPLATPLLVGLGFSELSMSPSRIGWVKRLLRKIRLPFAREAAEAALAAGTAEEVREILTARVEKLEAE